MGRLRGLGFAPPLCAFHSFSTCSSVCRGRSGERNHADRIPQQVVAVRVLFQFFEQLLDLRNLAAGAFDPRLPSQQIAIDDGATTFRSRSIGQCEELLDRCNGHGRIEPLELNDDEIRSVAGQFTERLLDQFVLRRERACNTNCLATASCSLTSGEPASNCDTIS